MGNYAPTITKDEHEHCTHSILTNTKPFKGQDGFGNKRLFYCERCLICKNVICYFDSEENVFEHFTIVGGKNG